MAIDNTKTIDLIERTGDGALVLKIVDHLDWAELVTHEYMLQEKLNAYCVYIETGQIRADYPEAEHSEVRIEHVYFSEPPEPAKRFLEEVGATLRSSGIPFRSRPYGGTKGTAV